MKKLLIILLIIPVIAYAQTTEQLDFIAPFSDDVAAVKKGDSWEFINKKDTVVIAFFNNNKAIVLEIDKKKLGTNNVLSKDVINYKYYEVIIDSNGNVENYLTSKGPHIALNKKFPKTLPKITSKRISNNIIYCYHKK